MPALTPMISESSAWPRTYDASACSMLRSSGVSSASRREAPVDDAAEPLHVEQHVDRDHDHQHDAENSVLPIEIAAPSTNVTIRFVYLPTSRCRICRTSRWPLSWILIDSRRCVLSQCCSRSTSLVGRRLSGRPVTIVK